MRHVVGLVGQTVVWLVILGVLAVLAVGVLVPRVAGATPYSILTGSMKPDLPPGTLVVVKPVAPEDVRAGDVLTIQLKSGRPTVVTHRVTNIITNLEGDVVFETKGDANNAPDADRRQAEQIRGKLWYAVPHLGRVNGWISASTRQLVTSGLVAALAIYALWMFGSTTVDRRRNRHRKGGSGAA